MTPRTALRLNGAAADGGHGIDVLVVLALGALILGAGLGLRDPWPPDEPRFALMARDMVLSGQWLFPVRAGELYADKPPLFMWLVGAGFRLTGSLRVAFLLPGLIAGLGTLWLVYDLARRLWDRRAGLAAALLLLATFQFTFLARSGQIDPVLMFWTTLALYALLRHLQLGPRWGWYCCGWAAAGFGIITKGVGFLPLLVLLPYMYARLRAWPVAVRGGGWRWAAGPPCLLLAVCVWLVPMMLAVHTLGEPGFTAYRDEILLGQTVGRYVAPGGHFQPGWYFFVDVIPLFWLPLSVLLPWLLPRWVADLRHRDTERLLLLGWAVLVIAFFTASPAKRGVYLLPALPAVVLAAAPHLPRLLRQDGVRRAAFCLSAAVTLLLGLTLLHYCVLDPAAGARLVAEYGVSPWKPLAGLLLAFFVILAVTRRTRAVQGAALVIASFWLIGGWWLSPVVSLAVSGARFMSEVESMLDADQALGIVRFKEKFLVTAQRPVTHFGYRRADLGQELADAAAWLVRAHNRRLLTGEEGWQDCFDAAQAHFVAREGGRDWYLIPPAAAKPPCVAAGDAGRAIEYVAGRSFSPLAAEEHSIDARSGAP